MDGSIVNTFRISQDTARVLSNATFAIMVASMGLLLHIHRKSPSVPRTLNIRFIGLMLYMALCYKVIGSADADGFVSILAEPGNRPARQAVTIHAGVAGINLVLIGYGLLDFAGTETAREILWPVSAFAAPTFIDYLLRVYGSTSRAAFLFSVAIMGVAVVSFTVFAREVVVHRVAKLRAQRDPLAEVYATYSKAIVFCIALHHSSLPLSKLISPQALLMGWMILDLISGPVLGISVALACHRAWVEHVQTVEPLVPEKETETTPVA